MTPKQFLAFLTPNEMGEIVNSSNGAVKILMWTAVITGVFDIMDPATAEALGGFFTLDRAAAFQTYVAGLPAPVGPAVALSAAGFTDAQTAALVSLLAPN